MIKIGNSYIGWSKCGNHVFISIDRWSKAERSVGFRGPDHLIVVDLNANEEVIYIEIFGFNL